MVLADNLADRQLRQKHSLRGGVQNIFYVDGHYNLLQCTVYTTTHRWT